MFRDHAGGIGASVPIKHKFIVTVRTISLAAGEADGAMTNTDRFILAVLCLTATAALAYLATPLVPAPDVDPLRTKIWELAVGVLSAAGTLGAVVVALWLGRDGQRRLDRSEMHRATLTAAKIAHIVSRLGNRVRLVDTTLAFCDDLRDQAVQIFMFAKDARPLLDAFRDEDFLSLMALPNHVGGRLAASIAKLRFICARDAEAGSPFEDADEMNFAIHTMRTAGEALWVVSAALSELASGVAPELTMEELHGDPEDYVDSESMTQ